jgi:hypothetical protein
VSLILILAALAGPAHAQDTARPASEDGFDKGRWHAEFAVQAALEAWNYNTSHEELYGLLQGVTYGLRDGLVVTARQRLYYVSQRLNDTRVLGLTAGLRARVYQRGRASGFVQFDLGVSDSPIAVPRRGTRFNYLALGGAGLAFRLTPRVRMVTTLELLHLSNAGLAGHDRNPDIEAIGPSLGLSIGLR